MNMNFFNKTLLLLTYILLSSCSSFGNVDTSPPTPNDDSVDLKQIKQKPSPQLNLSSNNYNNQTELLALKGLVQYLRNSRVLINNAQVVQNKDSRYKFDYDAFRFDMEQVVDAIDRFVEQDKGDQTPRIVPALIKRY